MDQASAETDVSRIMVNLEAQHKYLTWRAEKVGESVPCSVTSNLLYALFCIYKI